jgi:hypothetical protein
MANQLRRFATLTGHALALTIATALTDCTSPLWWHNPDRGFLYKGWSPIRRRWFANAKPSLPSWVA